GVRSAGRWTMLPNIDGTGTMAGAVGQPSCRDVTRRDQRARRGGIEGRRRGAAPSELFGGMLCVLMGGMALREFAAAIHVDETVVSRWRRNRRVPTLNSEHVANIARALGLNAQQQARLRQVQIASLSKPRRGAPDRPTQARASHRAVDQLLERS